MSANRPTGGAALVRQRVSGLVFLGVLVGLIGLSIAFYQKAFTDVTLVTLETDRIGNQLTPPADVKVNGVRIGEAREVEATEDGADITLALEPDAAARLPENVSARLVPKTLFGEKYVELVLPDSPSGDGLAAGSTIPRDKTATAREFSVALDNLLPLLQTLKPESLSTTLNAVSSSLRGRGDRIGSNLVLAGDYFEQFNPELPRLETNLAGTADLADTITAATPDIVSFLDDISAVNRNLVRDQAAIDRVLRDTAAVSGTLDEFVTANERRFVALAREGRGPLELFAKYAPEYPCMAKGLADSNLFIGDSFGRLQPGLHITLEFTENNGPYLPGQDEPQYLDRSGPNCFGLPRPGVPAPDINYQDGYRDDLPGDTSTGPRDAGSASAAPAAFSTAVAERQLLNAVVAPVLGVDTDRVPDVARLLLGPMARGTAVGLSDGSTGSPRSAS